MSNVVPISQAKSRAAGPALDFYRMGLEDELKDWERRRGGRVRRARRSLAQVLRGLAEWVER